MTEATGRGIDLIQTREVRDLAAEVKFVVSPAAARRIREWARTMLAPDPHGHGTYGDEYRITSLYLDTPELAVFNRQGSYGRAKYRVRRYGQSDLVFLERKLRTSSCLVKRRTSLALDDLGIVESSDGPRWAGSWFSERIAARRLQPVCQVTYDRIARVGMSADGPIRLTLDEHLSANFASGFEFEADAGRSVLASEIILEIKFRRAVPAIFRQLVETFQLAPAPISKYRLSIAALRSPVEAAAQGSPTRQLAFA